MGVLVFSLLMNYLEFLQPLEFAIYDSLFLTKKLETVDKKIIIVARTEDDIATGNAMPDGNLVFLLNKILSQSPKIIGLDWYRDKQVTSSKFTDEENDFYYQRLNQIFKETNNLIGVAKVAPPLIAPNKVLQEEERVGATDLAVDKDNKVRRSYIYPLQDSEGEPAENPYLAVFIASEYLKQVGFSTSKVEKHDMKFFNESKNLESRIRTLQDFSGAYGKKKEGNSFLVNWRKATFDMVSTTDVLSNKIDENLFTDKVVLIGTTSISTSDRHDLAINRWNQDKTWTYGVETIAQIVSDLINSATEGRMRINYIPEWLEIVLLSSSLLIINWVINSKYKQGLIESVNSSLLITILVILALLLISYLGFINGYWIPIAPSLLACIIFPIILNNFLYIDKIQTNNRNIKRLFSDINHSLTNSFVSLLSKIEFSEYILSLLKNKDVNKEQIQLLEERMGVNLEDNLSENISASLLLLQKINKIRNNSRTYFGSLFLGEELFKVHRTNFNQLVLDTATEYFKIKKIEYNTQVETTINLDERITNLFLDIQSIERVIENLIDNAFYAIKEKYKKNGCNQDGSITVNTIKKKNQVLLELIDNGIGISEDKLERIFFPFTSFRAKSKGHGLGLSLVKETMNFHKGLIKVESIEMSYTKFTLTFFTHLKK